MRYAAIRGLRPSDYIYQPKMFYMEKVQLSFGDTLKDSVTIGLKNAPSILGCIALWIITIWIPWINVGTTIAIMTLPIELSKGHVISPTSIFDAKYRKYFGEVFMTMGLMYIPIFIAMMFMIIPGIVLGIAWSLSIYLVLDKGKNPTAAISASNEATYGSKWAIFGVMLVLAICIVILGIVLGLIFGLMKIAIVGSIITYIIGFSLQVAANASIYRQLQNNVE